MFSVIAFFGLLIYLFGGDFVWWAWAAMLAGLLADMCVLMFLKSQGL